MPERKERAKYFHLPGGCGFDFALRTRVIFGEGALSRLGDEIKGLGARKVLIVTSKSMPDREPVRAALAALDPAGIHYVLFSSVPPEPTLEDVNACREFARGSGPDLMVGFGGGSAMDVAKIVAAELKLPRIMVPTTAGSGSEVTCNSVIMVEGRKKSFSDPRLAADVALVDPDLLATLPAAGLVPPAMDAMSHAMESYGSKKANEIVRAIALEGYLLIKSGIKSAVMGNAGSRRDISLGSLMAGMALSNTGTTLGHALANSLSKYGMPHGQALALILPYLMKVNRFDAGYAAQIKSLRLKYCTFPVIAWNIPEMAAEVAADDRHLNNNPRPVTLEEITRIYEGIRRETSSASRGHGSASH